MGISYAGIDLLLPTPELQAWLDRYLPTAETALFGGEPAAVRSSMTGTRGDNKTGVGLPLPNYPSAPPLRLNSLYWPTGATRWGRMVALATAQQLQQIYLKPAVYGVRQLLVHDGNTVVTAQMHMLEPRPLAGFSAVQAENLWLLPLVDERYLWQFRHMPPYEPSDISSWNAVFTLLGIALDKPLAVSTIDPRFLSPDKTELFRPAANPAVLLDAVCHSIGHRFVLQPDVGYFSDRSWRMNEIRPAVAASQNASGGLHVFETNKWRFVDRPASLDSQPQYTDKRPVSGGWRNAGCAPLPYRLRIAAPREDDDVLDANGQRYTVEALICGGAPTVKLLQTTCLARFRGGTDEPDNAARLVQLARALRSAYVDWRTYKVDVSLPGCALYRITGFDDYVEWQTFGLASNGEYAAITRAQSLPEDFGVEQQLSQDYCELEAVSSTTTTTTTADPTGEIQPCYGRCKWIWSDSAQAWELDTDECSSSPTTTTTEEPETTTSTTTTTPDPSDPCAWTMETLPEDDYESCDCSNVPTTTSTTPEATTTTTTTTTPDPCECIYPTFCGDEDGQCTYTQCVSGEVPPKVECTTTTTPDPETTTTTPDCETTTTADPSCTQCCWVWTGLAWAKISDGCDGDCTCAYPSVGQSCGPVYTPCVKPPPDPPPPACVGECTWYWFTPSDCDGNESPGRWVYVSGNCSLIEDCYCAPPSQDGSGCETISMPCVRPGTTTVDPCTTMTTTTTTANPCEGAECRYECQGGGSGEWLLVSTPPCDGCYCPDPPTDCLDDCEVYVTVPQGICGVTTTTTPEVTTTTTTTTTLEPCTGLEEGPRVTCWRCVKHASHELYYWAGPTAECKECDSPYVPHGGMNNSISPCNASTVGEVYCHETCTCNAPTSGCTNMPLDPVNAVFWCIDGEWRLIGGVLPEEIQALYPDCGVGNLAGCPGLDVVTLDNLGTDSGSPGAKNWLQALPSEPCSPDCSCYAMNYDGLATTTTTTTAEPWFCTGDPCPPSESGGCEQSVGGVWPEDVCSGPYATESECLENCIVP